MRTFGTWIMVCGGAIAAGFATWLYMAPLTGANGTIGALLAFLGGLCIAVGSLLQGWMVHRGLRAVLLILIFLAIVLTGIAGWFLLTLGISIGASVALLGWIAALAPSRTSSRRQA